MPKERTVATIEQELKYQAKKQGIPLEEYKIMRANKPARSWAVPRSDAYMQVLGPYIGKKIGDVVEPTCISKTTPKKRGPKPKTKLAKREPQVRTSRNFVNNRDLVEQVKLSKQQNKITDHLAKMFMEMTKRYGLKANFSKYTYIEDMEGYALEMLVKNWMKFDETRFDNAFSYYTSFIHNAFIQYLNKEKSVRDLRDKLMVNAGLNPSFNYEDGYEE